MKDLTEDVERFISFFLEKVAQIHSPDSKIIDKTFKKMLSTGLLDALSRTATYPGLRNRERLVSFIRCFSGWKHCDKVSLPHLIKLLEMIPDPALSELRKYTHSLMGQWTPGLFTPTAINDPEYDDIVRKWPKDFPKALENIKLEHMQHVYLFYQMRNGLVHELRQLGYGMEIGKDEEPYYHTYNDIDNGMSWELVYPTIFYRKLCEDSISNLRTYYLSNKINPYNYFNFGSYWFDEFNR